MSEYKIGDLVEVIGHGMYYSKGDQFRVVKVACGAISDDYGLWMDDSLVKVVTETESDKRGAKFGIGGVIKVTKKKCVFVRDSLVMRGWWEILAEGETKTWHRTPEQIRLDHEPEYREIPFSEATHEQRMDVSALRFDGTPVEQIFQFDNGEYMFTIPACKAVANAWNILKVHIPA